MNIKLQNVGKILCRRRSMDALCVVAMCLLPSIVLANGTGNFSLHWPTRIYVWHYNLQHTPAWLMKDEALTLIREAVAGWEACGVTLHYAGLTEKSPGTIDGENVIGWQEDGERYSAWTSWAAHRDGRAIEADVKLYANIFENYRRRGIDARLELRKSIIHEFGHILGLGHSDRAEDAMSVKVRTRPEWRQPSDHDIARCRELYPGP